MGRKEILARNRKKLGPFCLIFNYEPENCDNCPYHYHCLKKEREMREDSENKVRGDHPTMILIDDDPIGDQE